MKVKILFSVAGAALMLAVVATAKAEPQDQSLSLRGSTHVMIAAETTVVARRS